MKPDRLPWIALFVLGILTGCAEDIEMQANIGQPAPAFELPLLDGGSMTIDGQPGNAKAITFMSSWCPCSNESIPLLKQIHTKYEQQGVDVLMIGIQDPESKFRKFVTGHDLPFPAAYDDGDRIARTYGINSPPTTVFIDKNGTLRRIFYGNIKDMESHVYTWVEEIL
ncbi:MAG: TlpA family protein disulfide reductase [Gammaproteobacteria bacterium]|jgi:peroxiredoxin|nr:TlpA family protein disulfide reductase [Gammaproteobacteria bacterium]MBT4493873.1 TlpA family protein disulfide reductase [Gammaproteobacteria bacterium]MBT7372141.1 TlpA family protein disulfide reductase [Gammaproteobacteria bacterium]